MEKEKKKEREKGGAEQSIHSSNVSRRRYGDEGCVDLDEAHPWGVVLTIRYRAVANTPGTLNLFAQHANTSSVSALSASRGGAGVIGVLTSTFTTPGRT